MALTVYVYSNGAVAKAVFDAVAAFMSGNPGDISILLTLGFTFGAVGATCQYVFGAKKDGMSFIKWLAVYTFVSAVLLKPFPDDIQIIDATDLNASYFVANVPIGVALPAYFSSTLLYGITKDIEDVYHTPQELDYSQTGMLFGAKLFGITTQSQLYNSDDAQVFSQFVQNCIIPEVSRGEYAFSDLAASNDLKQFFADHTLSPLYGINIQGGFQTCQAAWPLIQASVSGEASQTMINQAQALFPGSVANQGKMNNYVNAAYGYYFKNLSTSSSDLMQQNILANAIKNGGLALTSATDVMAAQVNYATATSEMRQDISFMSLGQMAADVLPLMQTIFFLFLVGIFPLILFLASIQSLTFTVLKNYALGFFYVSSWAVLFDLLNFIMNSVTEYYFSSYSGVTISNLSSLNQVAYHTQAYCGYLMMAVPFMPNWIIKGMSAGLSSMSQYLGGAAHGFSAQAATEAAGGNFSMGDTSIGNHSWNNTNANKFDTNTFQASGMTSIQTASGAIASTMPDGSHVYNASPALSHMPSNVNTSENFQAAAQNRYSKDMSSIHSIQQERQQLISDTTNMSTQLSEQLASSQTVGTGSSYGNQSSIGEAASSLADHLKSYSQGLSTAHENNSNMQTSASAGLSAEAGVGVSGGVAKAGVGVNAGVNANAQSNDQVSATLSASQHENTDLKNSISHDISQLSQAANNTHAETSNAKTHQLVSDIQANWSKIDQLSRQESSLQQDAQSTQSAFEMSKSSGFSLNDETINNLVLSKAVASNDPMVLGAVTNPHPTETQRGIRDSFARSVIESEVLPSLGNYASVGSQVVAGGQTVQSAVAAGSSSVGFDQQAAGLGSAAASNRAGVKAGYQGVGSTPSYQSVTSTAQSQMGSAGGDINAKDKGMQQQNQVVQNTVLSNQSKMTENANKGAVHTMADHVETAAAGAAGAVGEAVGSETFTNLPKEATESQNRNYTDLSKKGVQK